MSSTKRVIEIPAKLIRQLEKTRQTRSRAIAKWHTIFGVKRGSRLVISCKGKSLNHYKGQQYPRDILVLASQGWAKRKSAGSHFDILSYGKNPALVQSDLDDEIGFNDLGLCDGINQALAEMKIHKLTNIQRLALPDLLKGRNVALAAETGSGKTLAYGIPLVNGLHTAQGRSSVDDIETNEGNGKPSSVVLLPTAQLTRQVTDVLKRLALSTNVRIYNTSVPAFATGLEEPQDIVIGTPQTLCNYQRLGVLSLERVRHCIIDEADFLLNDRSIGVVQELLQNIVFQIHKAPSNTPQPGAQLIISSASFPSDMETVLDGIIGSNNIKLIRSEGLHRVMPHVLHRFYRVSKELLPEKALSMLRYVSKKKHGGATIMFANSRKTCNWLTKFLNDAGIPARELSDRNSGSGDSEENVFEQFQSGQFKILVATARGARGLDTSQVVNVINYELPRRISDYIHQAGRVGRVNSKYGGNIVTSFISRRGDVPLVHLIEESVRRRYSLPYVETVSSEDKIDVIDDYDNEL